MTTVRKLFYVTSWYIAFIWTPFHVASSHLKHKLMLCYQLSPLFSKFVMCIVDLGIDRISKLFLAKLAYVVLKVVNAQGIIMDTF